MDTVIALGWCQRATRNASTTAVNPAAGSDTGSIGTDSGSILPGDTGSNDTRSSGGRTNSSAPDFAAVDFT
jgi:hypothetical protein